MADVETDHQQNFNFLKANHRQQIPLHPQRIHSDIQNDPKKVTSWETCMYGMEVIV